ncbi:MAG: hypothetical protein F6K32_02710 [Desertifilum sp. SIO1I2]|nr:hypothetical protein [Desertifilum sp. SIO1I2]
MDVPNQLRGKSASLRIQLDSATPEVYLDDVFFKSDHLLFGNPTEGRIEFNPDTSEEQNGFLNETHNYNYLIERPQYTLSYNDLTKNPNWVSWKLNRTWLGLGLEEERTNLFEEDRKLPSHWQRVRGSGDIVRGEPWRSTDNQPYERGHMAPSRDRGRNHKDNAATFLMTNMLPQNQQNNESGNWWRGLENFSQDLVRSGRELYIIAGGRGERAQILSQEGFWISVPERLWKVVLVLDRPGQGLADVTSNTMAFAVDIPNINPANDNPQINNWQNYVISVDELETLLQQQPLPDNYNFLSNIPTDIQEIIESRSRTEIRQWIDSALLNSPLMAEPETINSDAFTHLTAFSPNASIWHNGFTENDIIHSSIKDSTAQIGITHVTIIESDLIKDSPSKYDVTEISAFERSLPKLSTAQISPLQISAPQTSFLERSSSQVGTHEIGIFQDSPLEVSGWQIGIPKVSPSSSSKVHLRDIQSWQTESSKLKDTSIIEFPEFFKAFHNSTPESINAYKDNALTLWTSLLQPQTPLNINLLFTDLPTGQLAEAQITKFDPQGRPNGGTLLIDHNANGIGWYIDPTPFDHSEFSQPLTDTAFRATPDSPAAGRYDLLTTLLHEMGHLAGFISGYNGYDNHIQTLNGSPLFVGDNFSAFLTPDKSHLDPKLYPYDLMNPTLTPGVRKLPSLIDLQILNAIRHSTATDSHIAALSAPLTSTPLIGILNGNFDTTLDGWTTRGITTILNEQATLSEDERFLSNLSQTFQIPEGAKYLQFTLKDTTLGTNLSAPPDAFEVALLDTRTKLSLVDTATGLTQTDSFLNLQHDGQAYFGSGVTLPSTATPGSSLSLYSPMTFKVDVSGIAAGTLATLYFDLLGFGEKDARIILDNVLILTNEPIAPVANNDTATTDQANPVVIEVLSNDSDDDGNIDPTTVAIGTNPTNGIVQINADGTLTYIPTGNFVGTDSFIYTVLDNDGVTSNAATVTVTVNNTAPTITSLFGDTSLNEGEEATFTATATDPVRSHFLGSRDAPYQIDARLG